MRRALELRGATMAINNIAENLEGTRENELPEDLVSRATEVINLLTKAAITLRHLAGDLALVELDAIEEEEEKRLEDS